jgi:hypothetical protein
VCVSVCVCVCECVSARVCVCVCVCVGAIACYVLASLKNRTRFCQVRPTKGCYVGAWSAPFDDLTAWSGAHVALTLRDGHALFNNDVALV